MNSEILITIGNRFVFEPEIIKKFESIMNVRFGSNSEYHAKLHAFLSGRVKTIPEDDIDFIDELKRLNLMNLRARLDFLENRKTPETVIIAYLKVLYKEMSTHRFADFLPVELVEAEDKMLSHILDEAYYNEDLTELEGLNNTNLRLVLQSWALAPEYLHASAQCSELLECLSVSNYRF